MVFLGVLGGWVESVWWFVAWSGLSLSGYGCSGFGGAGQLAVFAFCGIGTSFVGAVGLVRQVVDAGASFPNRKVVV